MMSLSKIPSSPVSDNKKNIFTVNIVSIARVVNVPPSMSFVCDIMYGINQILQSFWSDIRK